MLLVIDAGNTNTVFAIFDGNKIVGTWRLSSDGRRTADEYALALAELMNIRKISFSSIEDTIISSVVPQSIFPLKTFCRQYFNKDPLVVGESNVKLPLGIKLDDPSEVGADRLVNAVAAYDLYASAAIVIDFGTATTFDVIDKKGNYIGGLIAPGIDLSIAALHKAAARLPEIAVEKPKKVIGKNTVAAMQSGIYWGYVGLIEGIVAKIKEEQGEEIKVLATGGLAPLFSRATKVIERLEPDLTINGLLKIFSLNQG